MSEMLESGKFLIFDLYIFWLAKSYKKNKIRKRRRWSEFNTREEFGREERTKFNINYSLDIFYVL